MKGKTFVVMGVANKRSIATGIANKLISEGARVVFTYNDERSLGNIAELFGEDAAAISCDVTSDSDIERAFAEIKDMCHSIDGVVHSIAHAKKEELKNRFMETSRDGFSLAHDISAYSLIKVSKEATQLMIDGGSILALTYLGGERVVKNYNVMGVAKASLDASIKYLANDLGSMGIRVNGISAGPIKTLAAKGISGFNEIL